MVLTKGDDFYIDNPTPMNYIQDLCVLFEEKAGQQRIDSSHQIYTVKLVPNTCSQKIFQNFVGLLKDKCNKLKESFLFFALPRMSESKEELETGETLLEQKFKTRARNQVSCHWIKSHGVGQDDKTRYDVYALQIISLLTSQAVIQSMQTACFTYRLCLLQQFLAL